MNTYIKLGGASGVSYSYEPATIDSSWNNVAGNYAFAMSTVAGQWCVLYVGETSSLRDCLSIQDRWSEAVSFGCTHVLAHVNDGGDQARQLEERDLVEGLAPRMNRNFDPMAQTWGAGATEAKRTDDHPRLS